MKFSNLYLSLAAAAFVGRLHTVVGQELELSTPVAPLGTAWAIDIKEPLTYSGGSKQFAGYYSHTKPGDQTDIRVYNECPHGVPPVPYPEYVGATISKNPGAPGSTGGNTYFTLQLLPSISTNTKWTRTPIDSETPSVSMCIWAGVKNGAGELVNFDELLLTITFNLLDDVLDVLYFKTQAWNPETQSPTIKVNGKVVLCEQRRMQADENSEMEATTETETELNFGGPPPPMRLFHNGDVVCIIVCPVAGDEAFYDTESVKQLEAKRVLTLGSTYVQQLIPNIPDQGQVDGPDCSGACCQVKFVLDGIFFPDDMTPRIVTISGQAVFVPTPAPALSARGGGRHLLRVPDARGLQTEPEGAVTGDFEMDIEVAKADDSSAFTVGKMTVAMGVAGAALLI